MPSRWFLLAPGEADLYLEELSQRGVTIVASDRQFGVVIFEGSDELVEELRGRGVEVTADLPMAPFGV